MNATKEIQRVCVEARAADDQVKLERDGGVALETPQTLAADAIAQARDRK
ncbi:hypothetical protein Bsp3421_000121 (plasmid) [Burkholderia sp. FERM BP-3421]|nr:hypothetical protein [Burkholderia sp. FERM BP-3421]WDD90296.1 hypothetical protein Bsp3421_000121 [Burkholderia sp. FERM BP-3421]